MGAATIDEALDLLADTGPEFGGGLSNHGPMGAEALIRLGRSEAVVPWVEGYKRRLGERPQARNPISHEDWREALGDVSRMGDWTSFFQRELTEATWRQVVASWAPALAPGLAAAATHGIIRTAHAVRSLEGGETPLRVRELAEGLAYWAARYMLLPGRPSPAVQGLSPDEAVQRLRPLPPPPAGERPRLITDWLRRLEDDPQFMSAIDLVDPSGDPSGFLSRLTEKFAELYLANAHTGHVIGFIHAVTGPRAARLLLPYVASDEAPNLVRYAWQTAAAIYAALGDRPSAGPIQPPSEGPDELTDRAVATGDEHAIKFTEACLSEHVLNPRPVYLAAARHVSDALKPRL